MDKVYLIFTGEYSGRDCVGFCTTEEEAIRYCAIKNRDIISAGYRPDYEYEEHECLDGKLVGNVRIGYSFKVEFKHVRNGWHVRWVDSGILSIEHCPVFDAFYGVTVWVKENDKKMAEKIAIDEFYRHLYERIERDRNFAERLKQHIQT